MKRISVIIGTLFLLTGMAVQAQMHGEIHQNFQQDTSYYMNPFHHDMQGNPMVGSGKSREMMHYGMTGHMVGTMGHYGAGMLHSGMIDRLPGLEEALDLSSPQYNQLVDMRAEYMKRRSQLNSKVSEERENLMGLVNRGASEKDFRSQLMSYYHSLIDLQAEAYATYKKMTQVLNQEQKQELKNKMADLCPYYGGDNQKVKYRDHYHHRGMPHHMRRNR